MSGFEPRAEVLERVRRALLDLLADGVDFARAPERASARSASQEQRDRTRGRAGAAEAASGAEAGETLELIREDLGDCTRCRLHEARQSVVFGEGNPAAAVVFVGEGPGAEEDRTGRPFVGRAGELLNRMIEAVGWRREDVYICNIIKCRPPGNRDPQLDEVATCRPFLDRQLLAIRPRAIVALGRPAASTLLGRQVAITKVRGVWHEWNGIPVLPTYHPAFVLRRYTRETRQAVWDDLRAVRSRVEQEPAP